MKRKARESLKKKQEISERRYQIELQRKGKRPNSAVNRIRRNRLLGKPLIEAPKVISIYRLDQGYYVETNDFVKDVVSTIQQENCVLDFRNTLTISAAAMLYLYAQIDCIPKEKRFKSDVLWPKQRSLKGLLRQTNFLKLIRKTEIYYDLKKREALPVIRGVGKSHFEDIVDHIQHKIFNNFGAEDEQRYSAAVSETINNVRLHAYPSKETEDKHWWLQCQVINDQLYLVIYDNGIGIPKTVTKRSWFLPSLKHAFPELLELLGPEKIKRFERLSDANLIALSMIGDVSGVEEHSRDKHGQGSKSIKGLVEQNDEGKLWVYSNKGLYVLDEDRENPTLYELPSRFDGTLVQWNIKIS